MKTNSARLRMRFAGPWPTFLVAVLSAGFGAMVLRATWGPPVNTYLEYLPIGALFAAFLWDGLLVSWLGNERQMACDLVVVALALMRVFIPPFPFVSGHTLFAMYAALTAGRWPVRSLALAVLVEVVWMKIFASRGWRSMLGGLVAAGILAAIRGPATQEEQA